MDAVEDVALEIVVNGVIFLQGVQRDLVEGERFGDFLEGRGESSVTVKKSCFY